jgi:hypothetical protein
VNTSVHPPFLTSRNHVIIVKCHVTWIGQSARILDLWYSLDMHDNIHVGVWSQTLWWAPLPRAFQGLGDRDDRFNHVLARIHSLCEPLLHAVYILLQAVHVFLFPPCRLISAQWFQLLWFLPETIVLRKF